MATIDILRYEARHHADVLELQRRLWSPWPVLNRSYFQWKFVDNPNAHYGDIFLAASGSRIVGMRGFMGTLWTNPDGEVVPIPLAGDTVVAKDYEGRGIVNRLSAEARSYFARRDIKFILNTSASPAVFLHSARSGWRLIGHYAEMRRRPGHRWLRNLARELRRLPFLPGPARDPFAAVGNSDWSLDDRMMVSLRSVPDPVALSVLCAAARPAQYAMVRDADFFRWRFANPFYRYYFLTCRHDARLAAYLAFSLQERKRGPDVRIVDWCSPEPADFRRLLDTFVRRLPSIAVNMLVNAATAAEQRDLTEAGFRQTAGDRNRRAPAPRFNPGVLAIPTANGGPGEDAVRALTEGGFDLLDFRGIESDGA